MIQPGDLHYLRERAAQQREGILLAGQHYDECWRQHIPCALLLALAEVDRLRAEVDVQTGARDLLRRYGAHLPSCPKHRSNGKHPPALECTCDFDDVRKGLEP